MKLVVYFSASGNTENVAQKIKDVSNADIFELKPLNDYTDEDLDWTNQNSRSSIEMKDPLSRPLFKDKLDSIDKYDYIYVGFPVWWYTCPHIVNTFLESYDFNNKIVRVFFTSGSTKEETILKSLKDKYPFIKDYKRFEKNEDENEINNYLKEEEKWKNQ